MLRYSGISVPRSYEADLQRALWTFRHQRVVDPATRRMVHLQPLPDGGLAAAAAQLPAAVTQLDPNELDFLGPLLPDAVVRGIASGEPLLCSAPVLRPMLRTPFFWMDLNRTQVIHFQLWLDEFASGAGFLW